MTEHPTADWTMPQFRAILGGGPKEQIIARYRSLLEIALGEPLQDSLWKRLTSVAIVRGARMLLWSKALGLDLAWPGAQEEWSWWVDRLSDPALT
jgi:hypothetical protein